MELTGEQWAVLDPLIGVMPRRRDGWGRPWRSSREVLNGILWILRTEAQWADLPERCPRYQTCHRRFQRWVREGTLERILEALAADLKERGGLDLSECFIHSTFVAAKKGVAVWVRLSGGKVRIAHGSGRPLWSTSCRLCCLGFASRESARRSDPRFTIRSCLAKEPHRGSRL